jgi:simple sugar transport system ATP-binding protein
LLELRGITKRFPGVLANDHVDFSLEKGEIHALLGENGAGKSTLMSVLYGLYQPDEGRIIMDEREVNLGSPRDAIDLGIGMVHQHFMLVPVLTVAQNVALGCRGLGLFQRRKALNQLVSALAGEFGLEVNPSDYVWQLPVGVQQRVEILKVLYRKARVIILDEPTAVLTESQSLSLFASLRAFAQKGHSVVVITHKLEEVLANADRITVMRQGRVVGTLAGHEATRSTLAKMMVGRDLARVRREEQTQPGEVALRVNGVSAVGDKGLMAVNGVDFEVHRGEIFGIAGVDGNGQMELGEALVGLRPLAGGTIEFFGQRADRWPVDTRLSKGLGYIPEDRQAKGLIMPFSVADNILLGSQRAASYSRGFLLDEQPVREHARAMMKEFDIRATDESARVEHLSGGNQQKVILARELGRETDILIASQPTRGLDIGATEFVHGRLLEERKRMKAVVLISSDLDEIRALSDRIAVMYRGRIVGITSPDASTEELGLLMAGSPSATRPTALTGGDQTAVQ